MAEGRFQMAGASLSVTIPEGRATLRLSSPDGQPLVLTRVAPFAGESPVGLAGTYFSSDLRTTITVEPRDSVLLIKPERGTPTTFTPVFADAFSAGFYFLQVVREGGRVTGVEVSGGERARRVRFDKQP